MPMIQIWELSQYQPAAEQMCMRLGDSPQVMVTTERGREPAWVQYALRMHEFRVMLDVMRQQGIPV